MYWRVLLGSSNREAIQIEFGDGEKTPKAESTAAMNALLENLKPGLKLS